MKLRCAIFLAIAAVVVSCTRKPDVGQPYVAFADKFARALAEGRFGEAHGMLADEQKTFISADALKKEYDGMIAYGPGPSKHVEAMQALDIWPEKKPGDVGWVYVAIAGESFSEGVTVVVARAGDRLAIRSIEWGRP
jgi:hypothetical protein